jgi:hypothetical protein
MRLLSILLLVLISSLSAQKNPAFNAENELVKIKPFLKQHCFSCHGQDKQKQQIRYDTLSADLSHPDTLGLWQDVVDQLNLGEMPPSKKPRPPEAQRKQIVDIMNVALRRAYQQKNSTGQQAVIRRLNKFELRNTLRDLFQFQHPDFQPSAMSELYDFNGNGITAFTTIEPTRAFSEDEQLKGFDNIGDKLVMSDFLLKQVIGAAEECINLATVEDKQKPFENKTWKSPISKKGLHGNSLGRYQRNLNKGYDEVFQKFDRYNRIGPDKFHSGMGISGTYKISVELSGHNQKHPWGDILQTNQSEPFAIGLYLERKEHLRGPQMMRKVQWKIPGDGKKRTFSFTAYIDKKWTPWIGWENGPHIKHNVHGNIVKKYYPDHYADGKGKKRDVWAKQMAEVLFKQGYKGPTVRIHSMRIERVKTQWPPKSHAALYGDGKSKDNKKLLLTFIERAYRRPAKASDADEYLKLIDEMKTKGQNEKQALQTAYIAILCSPEFLYIKQKSSDLSDYEIAERLSYFLWSSMPDEKLFKLAREGKIRNKQNLLNEVERMLKDPKAAAFSRHFTERWLHLHDLGKMPPDKKGPLKGYYQITKKKLLDQVDFFFADLLRSNGSIRNFIVSDYTFSNEMLDRYIYKQGGLVGAELQKVKLKDKRHGGIFTMPAVMTVTANGVDTSPILRGVFVLENILGTPPSPPPPDVEPLAADVSGAKTLKEELAAHREHEACNSCHRKIDPMGFAMESFDAIGQFRTHYPKVDKKSRKPAELVDATSEMSDGTKIKDISEFKQMLLKKEDLVYRCLTEKMMTYASGRLMEPGDRGEIDRITGLHKKGGLGLKNLVKLIVLSSIFIKK